MPVIGISVEQLRTLLGQDLSQEELADTLEKLGCDLEDIGKIVFFQCPKCGAYIERMEHEEAPKACSFCGNESEEPFEKVGEDEVIRLDLLPARPDLFDAGGLSRAIKGYLSIETGLKKYELGSGNWEVRVSPELSESSSYRPFIACAVMELPAIDASTLRMIMKLQENLHWGIGRDRKLASIGIYDLATIQGPIEYKAVAPEELKFCPLGNPGELMTPKQVLENHAKGKAYAHLLEDHKKYPLLVDSKGQVLSLPPIINSDETKVKVGTTKVFIDVTGITPGDVDKSLNTLVSSLAELGGKVTSVKMVFPDKETTTPVLEPGKITINLESARRWLGLPLPIPEFTKNIERMRFSAEGKFPFYEISYPSFRTDIKHEVDVFEDLAIAYGYHNIDYTLVPTMTVAQARPEEDAARLVREIMLGMGFMEIMSLMLTTEANHFTKLNMEVSQLHAVVQNPKLVEYNVVRCHLLTGLLESLVKNRRKPMPQKFFELGNVIHRCDHSDTYTCEEKRVAFAITGDTGYAEIRSVLDSLLKEMGEEGEYTAFEHPTFVPGRCAKVSLSGDRVAVIGEVHPQVLNNFGLSHPVTLAEMTLMKLFS